MKSKGDNRPFGRGSFNTLAQSGTTNMSFGTAIVQGKGTDLGDKKALKGRAKRKLITQSMILGLVDVTNNEDYKDQKQSYWNTYHCQNKVYTADSRLYGRYCKNRYCTLCCAIRKADIINRYLPEVQKWEQPYFVTLTVRAKPLKSLNKVMKGMIRGFRLITSKQRKRAQRGKGSRLMGIRSLECNYNPIKKTYNPHFHVIVPDEKSADLLINEWLRLWTPKWALKWAQNKSRITDNTKALIETVKYGSKIFSEPDMIKKANGGGDPKVYVSALHNIFLSMKGLRIFDRFGFNLQKTNTIREGARLVTNCSQWDFDISRFDWLGPKGEALTDYVPGTDLLRILQDQLDITSQ